MSMRTATVSVIALFLVSTLSAQQLHQATPVDELLREYHAHHHLIAEMPVPAVVNAVAPAATRTFIVSAHKFAFSINPSPFVVNQGDTVTLDLTATDTMHGFFLERYNVSATMNPGQHVARTFIASIAGTFTFACTVSSCGTGHPDMNDTFTVLAAATPPVITSFTPISGPTTGGTVVAITGSNFQNGATMKFGDAAAVSTTVNSATSISAIAPVHAAGDVTLTVTNPDGQSASFGTYTYTTPGPSITSIDPSSGPTSGGTVVTITGSNIDPNARVTIGGLAATSLAVTSPGGIAVRTPPGPFDIASSSPRDVVVTNPDGSSATRAGGFTWTLPAPAVTSIVPNASLPKGGAQVTIVGAGFTTALPVSVSFGGVAATNVQVIGPTALSVTVPAHTAGTVDVVVAVGSSNVTAASAFSFAEGGKRRRAVKH